MPGVKLCYLPDSQLLRVKAMANTCVRMDDLIVVYYEREELSLKTAKVCRFDNQLALKKIEELEKIFTRMRKNFGIPEKLQVDEKKGDEAGEQNTGSLCNN